MTHALAGVACALRDRTPMLVLTAGVRAGAERFQLHDVDNLAVLKPVCKALFRPASVEEIGESIAAACKAALTGRPGPVGVEIACDWVAVEELNTLRQYKSVARKPHYLLCTHITLT